MGVPQTCLSLSNLSSVPCLYEGYAKPNVAKFNSSILIQFNIYLFNSVRICSIQSLHSFNLIRIYSIEFLDSFNSISISIQFNLSLFNSISISIQCSPKFIQSWGLG